MIEPTDESDAALHQTRCLIDICNSIGNRSLTLEETNEWTTI